MALGKVLEVVHSQPCSIMQTVRDYGVGVMLFSAWGVYTMFTLSRGLQISIRVVNFFQFFFKH